MSEQKSRVLSSHRLSLDLSHLLGSEFLTPEENHQVYGKCGREAGHGHRWNVTVTAYLSLDTLKDVTNEAIMDVFDHRNLNAQKSCADMHGVIPTVENFVYVAACVLKRVLLKRGMSPHVIKRLHVFETRTGSTQWDPTHDDIERLSDDHAAIKNDAYINIRPVMSVTKRIEIWSDPSSITPNSGDDILWRCEGPGAGVPRSAKYIDITLTGKVDTRKGMVENLSNIKDLAQRLLKRWTELAESSNDLSSPSEILDKYDDKQMRLLSTITREEMFKMKMDPSFLDKLHFEGEKTVTSIKHENGIRVQNSLTTMGELTWKVSGDFPPLDLGKRDTSDYEGASFISGNIDLNIIKHATTAILKAVGEDPSREGLKDTPERYAKALEFFNSGYFLKPKEVLGDAIFESDSRSPVVVNDIDVFTHCEHHLVPFYGQVHVGYVPTGKVIGLSKIPRLIEIFARRLQIQERLTKQIADCLFEEIEAAGVVVIVKCKHMCMCSRGVQKVNSETTTIYKRGVDSISCNEILRLMGF